MIHLLIGNRGAVQAEENVNGVELKDSRRMKDEL